MEKFIREVGKQIANVKADVLICEILLGVFFIWNIILTVNLFAVKTIQADMLKTKTMNTEVTKVWQLEEVPTEELK